MFSLNGERCTAGSRILVERSIYDEFVERYAAQAKRVVVGDPHDPKTEVGALVHPEHYDKVMRYIEIGKGEGRLVAGGGRPEGFADRQLRRPDGVRRRRRPTPASSRRRSSARSSRSPRSTPTRRRSSSRTA